MDKQTYDKPEPEGDQSGRAWMYLVGGLVVVLILLAVASGKVPMG
ncbi:MAG: hypothetical protein ACRDP1_10880 [Nocardioidaceae bacterium]